jgi:hypothetical protein
MDNVTTAEKAVHPTDVTIVEALGYAAGSDVAVASKVYSLAGTCAPSSGSVGCPGECAMLIRWSTAAVSTKNHPIYLFSYIHHALRSDGYLDNDHCDENQRPAGQTYATAWISGFSDGTITAKRASPAGHLATGSLVEEYLTHRDFPYTTSV